MQERSKTISAVGALSALGLIAALLSILLPALLTERASPVFIGSSLGLFPGDVFGAAISIYFLVFADVRSAGKTIALILASSFAYYAALFSGMSLGVYVSQAAGRAVDTNAIGLGAGMVAPLFVAGVVGAFVILLTVLRLFSSNGSWHQVLARSLFCAPLGGLLGLFGWASAPIVGKAVWSALAFLHLNPAGQDMKWASWAVNEYSLYIVWQTGMGCILGTTLSREPAGYTRETTSAPRRNLKISNAFLFGVMSLALIWFCGRSLPREYHQMRGRRAYATHVAETPSTAHLPAIQAVAPEVVLILTSFDEYLPGRANAAQGHFPPSGPQPQIYGVRYALAGAPTSGGNVGPHVDIQVQEWPNAAWAKWELDEQNFSPSLNDGVVQSVQFGNQIRLTRSNGQVHYAVSPVGRCAWASQNMVIMFDYYGVGLDNLLKDYLVKYPSSL